ncbi:MAG: hypothetical protein LBS89_08345, partial [Zoogloeaceae bacterium]|nr:hypothetical protein [Zoogloeaceae bacterium]
MQAALDYQPLDAAPERNAFVALAGFNAPAGNNFMQVGMENIRRFRAGHAPQREPLPLAFAHATPCHVKEAYDSLAKLHADAKKIRRFSAENQEMVRRYRLMQAMPNYINRLASSFGGETDFLRYRDVRCVSETLFAEAILEIEEGRATQGLDFIEKDLAFYRRIFASAEATLLDKRVALQHIEQQLTLVGFLIEQDALRGHEEKARLLLAPLDAPRAHLLEALERERIDWRIQKVSATTSILLIQP